MQPPEIITPRLLLVAPLLNHAKDLYSYGRDKEFSAALKTAPQRSLTEAERFVANLMQNNESGERSYWVAKLDGKAVGTLGFIFHDWRYIREAEFGYGFSPSTWGTGLFAEGAKACLQYGFDTLGLVRVRVYTRESNVRAQSAVRKIGFKDDFLLEDFYQDHEGCQSFAFERPSGA